MSALPPTESGTPSTTRIVLGNLKPLGRQANLQSLSQTHYQPGPAPRRKELVWRKGYFTGLSRACTPQYQRTYAWSTSTRPREHGYVALSTHRSTPLEVIHIPQAPNLQCFIDRVGMHPDRLQHVYFNTVLLLRAVSRLGPYLSAYDYCSTGTHEEDAQTKSLLGSIIDTARQVGKFDEKLMFAGEDANVSQGSPVRCCLPNDCTHRS